MKNRGTKRIIALILVVALAVSAVIGVSAANYLGDISGDGKITVFDAQLLAEAKAGKRELTDLQKKVAGNSTIEDILAYIFGKTTIDVGDMNADGVYEIYNVAGLQYMAEHPEGSYILEADLDLQGAAWTPIQLFTGSFNGNGHTISNLTITEAVPNNSTATEYNQGFFGGTGADSVVTDLALRNVTLTSADNAKYIGLVAGTARGTITGCTVTGAIYDSRTALNNDKFFLGVLVGRTTATALETSGGTSLSVTDDTGTYTVTDLCADVKLYIEKDSENVCYNGLVGYQYPDTSVTGLWRDNTNNISNESAVMQARQQTVVDYMQAMATVEWTVSETMNYVASGVHNQTFVPGQTYYGLPYNGRAGGLERFMSCMDNVNGVNVATTRYGTDCSKAAPSGWMRYMGNDCSSAVAWAWMQVSPNRVTGSSDTECAGGAYVITTNCMIPTDTAITTVDPPVYDNQGVQGIYPVGDWTTNTTLNSNGTCIYDDVVGTFAYQIPQAPNSADFLTLNGPTVLAEAYAVARKADAIVCGDPAGHARLLTAYPVVIRNADGTLDMDKSFLVCTEQGDGLYDADTNTSWRIDHKWSFNNLLGYTDPTLPTGYKYSKDVYLPITIRALRSDLVKHAYVDEGTAMTGPASGLLYSNWRIVSSTVIVKSGNNELFRNTVYTGLADASTVDGEKTYDAYRSNGQHVQLSLAHGEAYDAFAAENLEAGQTYQYSVQVLLANGKTLIVSRDSLHWKTNGHSGTEYDSFVYTPAE